MRKSAYFSPTFLFYCQCRCYLWHPRHGHDGDDGDDVPDAGVGAAVVAAEAVAGAVGVGVAGRPAVGAGVARAFVLRPGRRRGALQGLLRYIMARL